MCDELERTEAQWRQSPQAARNAQLLKNWKSQVQVSYIHYLDTSLPTYFCTLAIMSRPRYKLRIVYSAETTEGQAMC